MPTPVDGYRAADGQRIPGTTTVLGRFKESGGLIQWAYQQGRKGVPLYGSRDDAADVGTHIHSMVEARVRSLDVPAFPQGMGDDLRKQADSGFRAFVRWAENNHLEIAPVEVPLICECHRLGGTPDAIAAERDDTLSLLDWKSSKAFYWDQIIQLAIYRHLWDLTHPNEKITGSIHIVRFGKDGADFEHRSFPLDHPKLAIAWRLAELYREAYDLDKKLAGKT